MRGFALALGLVSVLLPGQLLATAQTITLTDLVGVLDTGATLESGDNSTSVGNTTFGSNVYGEILSLDPFSLSVLANETHALVTFNVTKSVKNIGYVAIGFGSMMADSAMAILWPNDDGSEWTLSHRSIDGYRQPLVDSSAPSEGAIFTIQQNLFDTYTVGKKSYTLVSFLRPLQVDPSQTFFPESSTSKLNLARENFQDIVYAFSSKRPSSMGLTAKIKQHDAGQYGTTSVNLASQFFNGTIGDATEVEVGAEYTKYDYIILVHAGLAMFTWLLVAPVAILVGRLGRAWDKWFTFHSRIQGFFTLPVMFAIAGLGMYAAYTAESTGIDAHKFFGFLILFCVLILVGLGYWSHKTLPEQTGTTRSPFAVAHMVLGVSTLVLAYIQIWLGFSEWNGRAVTPTIKTIYGVFIFGFFLFYGIAVGILVFSRRREGRSWRFAFFGLGSDQATASPRPWVGMMNWSSSSPKTGEEDARPIAAGGQNSPWAAWNK